MIERFVALTRRVDEHAEVVLDACLPQVLVESPRTERPVDLEVVFSERTRDETLGLGLLSGVAGLPDGAHRPLPSRCSAYLSRPEASLAAPS